VLLRLNRSRSTVLYSLVDFISPKVNLILTSRIRSFLVTKTVGAATPNRAVSCSPTPQLRLSLRFPFLPDPRIFVLEEVHGRPHCPTITSATSRPHYSWLRLLFSNWPTTIQSQTSCTTVHIHSTSLLVCSAGCFCPKLSISPTTDPRLGRHQARAHLRPTTIAAGCRGTITKGKPSQPRLNDLLSANTRRLVSRGFASQSQACPPSLSTATG